MSVDGSIDVNGFPYDMQVQNQGIRVLFMWKKKIKSKTPSSPGYKKLR